MSDEHSANPAVKEVPEFLHLTLHRAYFFGGLLSVLFGLVYHLIAGDQWSGLQPVMMGVFLLVSSYLKRVDLRAVIAISVFTFIGSALYKFHLETIEHFGWKDLRQPVYNTAIVTLVPLLLWWGEKRRGPDGSAEPGA